MHGLTLPGKREDAPNCKVFQNKLGQSTTGQCIKVAKSFWNNSRNFLWMVQVGDKIKNTCKDSQLQRSAKKVRSYEPLNSMKVHTEFHSYLVNRRKEIKKKNIPQTHLYVMCRDSVRSGKIMFRRMVIISTLAVPSIFNSYKENGNI